MSQRTRRLLFLFADTGGGHRSPAYAVAQALKTLYGNRVQARLVEALVDYAPWPLNCLNATYPYMVRMKAWPWAIGYRLSNGLHRARLITQACWPLARPSLLKLLREHPADAVVSCHPAFNHLALQALQQTSADIPLVTLVIDLTAAHAFWFVRGVSRCLVPTEETRRHALACGLSEERVLLTGLPVNPAFVRIAHENPLAVRERLGLDRDRPVVLIANGAEGMGAPYRICRAIAETCPEAQMVIIAGRNRRLRDRMALQTQSSPIRVEGFVHNMHEWMRAADLLVTKAGPSTIGEALAMGLPMVLSSALPGQERPNADYVVKAGAGIWAPTPERTAVAVCDLLTPGNPRLTHMAACARSLAQPEAACAAAKAIWTIAEG